MLGFFEIICYGLYMCVTMCQKSSAISWNDLHSCFKWGRLTSVVNPLMDFFCKRLQQLLMLKVIGTKKSQQL
jgi:hypothetical protein